jgi:hypothetical protein
MFEPPKCTTKDIPIRKDSLVIPPAPAGSRMYLACCIVSKTTPHMRTNFPQRRMLTFNINCFLSLLYSTTQHWKRVTQALAHGYLDLY